MKKIFSILFLMTITSPMVRAQIDTQDRLVHTYSIVARDPQTGEMGVAVQSNWFSVGSLVSWAEAGVAPLPLSLL